MVNVLSTTLFSVVAATIMAAFGYLKNKSEEDFSPAKFFSTYITAFSVAILLVAFNVPVETGEGLVFYFLSQSGAIALLERIYKWFWRTYLKDWYDGLGE